MLNKWRMPQWYQIVFYAVQTITMAVKAIIGFSWLAMPMIMLYLMVKLTPFFMSLR